MSYTQVLEEIKKWDNDQKWLLLEKLLHELRQASEGHSESPSSAKRLEIANALYGSIRPSDRSIPDDEEVRRILNEERFAKYG